MSWNNFEMESDIDYKSESLLSETAQALNEYKQELQDRNQYFEYKNRSKDWKYFVFSYNAITWESTDDIKKKYVNQYWWNMDGILITNDEWKELPIGEIKETQKVYLKVNRSDNPNPIKFYDVSFSEGWKYVCFIDRYGWTPHNIRQMYQDQIDKVIPEEEFILLDSDNKPYDESVKFKPWDVVSLQFKKPVSDYKTYKAEESKEENVKEELEEIIEEKVQEIPNNESVIEDSHIQEPTLDNTETIGVNRYAEMIKEQKGPIMYWNKKNPEISITFDDWYWVGNIKHILDTLRWSWIHATFFILWECLSQNPSLRKQAVNEWHQICCHTFSHIYLSSWEYTDLWDKERWEKWWPWDLNKTDLRNWVNNVENLLWTKYLNNLRQKSGSWFPRRVKTDLLLKTEILMWEAQIKKTLWEEYLNNFKLNYPFFRFPGWCWWKAPQNLAVLKELWYLSIWWSDDFYRWSGDSRRHIATSEMMNLNVWNGDIPLFHFKESDYKYVDAYIKNMEKHNKKPRLVSEVLPTEK